MKKGLIKLCGTASRNLASKGFCGISKVKWLAFSTLLLISCLAKAQVTNLYFEKDGSFRYTDEAAGKSKKNNAIRFSIESDSNAVFLIAISQAANYSLPGIGVKPKALLIENGLINDEKEGKTKKSKKGGKDENTVTNSDVTWEVDIEKGSNHLFYRIYRFPKELIYENVQEKIAYNSLLFELNRKASVRVERKRAALKNQLDALTFSEFIQLNKKYENYKTSLTRIQELKMTLSQFLNSNDSLSIDDRIEYNSIVAERNMYLKEIERNEQFISTDNALEYLKQVREKYLSTLSKVVKFESKKLTYRSIRERELRQQISHLSNQINILKEDLILKNFLRAEKFLNETYAYSLDILYEGHITLENETKEIEYNHHFNERLNTPLLERQTPVLPQLTNRNYLSVVVHNVPATLMTKEGNMPFQLSLEKDSTGRQYEQYVLKENKGLSIREIDSKESSIMRIEYKDIAQCQGFEKDVENMKVSEIVVSSLIDKNATNKDSCLLKFEKKLVSTVEARDVLYESIEHYGDEKVANSSQPMYRDYVMTRGKRFKSGSTPAVVINSSHDVYKNGKLTVNKVALINDSLEQVQRLRRFGISTGLVMKNMPYYSQRTENIPGTGFNKLVEKKFIDTSVQPVVFLSIYLKEQNIDLPSRRAGSINLGIDYADGDLLDNFYVGYGIEPIRHFQITLGVSLGRVDKVDMDSFDQLANTFQTKNEMAMGTFISANFYLSAISKIVSPILNK